MAALLHTSFLVTFLLFAVPARAQDTLHNAADDSLHSYRLALVTGITSAGFIYGYTMQHAMWWKGEKSPFHFEWKQDWTYALGSDKFGHAYFPYLVSNIYCKLFQWSGVNETKSIWLGSALGMSYQTFIEIRDGFSKEWGFSWGDFTADLLGSSYPVAQYYYPWLRNITLKISYYPSNRFREHHNSTLIDDYESTYDWVSVSVHSLLPYECKKFWPAFVNLALGHSVKNLDDPSGGHHEFYLGLDWNLLSIPDSWWLYRILKNTIGYYHLPAPAIRIYPGVTWYGFKF
jgi:hypothetical protein